MDKCLKFNYCVQCACKQSFCAGAKMAADAYSVMLFSFFFFYTFAYFVHHRTVQEFLLRSIFEVFCIKVHVKVHRLYTSSSVFFMESALNLRKQL